jgi:hypothetical protein
MISVVQKYTWFSGGMRSSYHRCYNFDLDTGMRIPLEHFVGYNLQAFDNKLAEFSCEQLRDVGYYDSDEEIMRLLNEDSYVDFADYEYYYDGEYIYIVLEDIFMSTGSGKIVKYELSDLAMTLPEADLSPIEDNEYYSIVQIQRARTNLERRHTDDDSPITEYLILIYDTDGNVVYKNMFDKYPQIDVIEQKYVHIRNTYGTGGWQDMVCDTELNKLSEWFDSAALFYDGLVVGMIYIPSAKGENSITVLQVRDIFDKSVYCEEFERDFSPVANVGTILKTAKLLDDNTLYVEYLSGDDYTVMSETIILNRP